MIDLISVLDVEPLYRIACDKWIGNLLLTVYKADAIVYVNM